MPGGTEGVVTRCKRNGSPLREKRNMNVGLVAMSGVRACDAEISTFTAQVKEAYALARRFIDRGIPIVMGGLHA